MKNIWIVSFLIFNASLTILFGQPTQWNLDFEEWNLNDSTPKLWHDTTIVENRVGLFPPKWHFRPDHIPERTGLARTTDATTGKYAVALSGFYSYQVMRIISGDHHVNSGWPIDFRPTSLTGDYKSILLGSCDSLRTYVDIYLTNYDQLKNKRDTIGQANLVLKEKSSYDNFELKINYIDQFSRPDTVIIVLAKERFGFDSPPACLECSHVFFDNLKLSTSVATQQSNDPINVYEIFPNPTNSHVTIKTTCKECTFSIVLFSACGQKIKAYDAVMDELKIQTNNMSKGLYFIKIEDKVNESHCFKKLVIE